jgi:hypothetical protein
MPAGNLTSRNDGLTMPMIDAATEFFEAIISPALVEYHECLEI